MDAFSDFCKYLQTVYHQFHTATRLCESKPRRLQTVPLQHLNFTKPSSGKVWQNSQ